MSDGLPQGWASAKLGELISFALGGDWGKGSDEITEGFVKVRVIRGTEFKSWRDQKGASAAQRWIKESSLERRGLAKGDIVLEVSGGGPNQPVGRTVLIDEETLRRADSPLICSNFFRQLRLRSEVDARFVSHFLDYAYAKGVFNEYQTQTTNLRNLNVADFLENTDIWIAPPAEQQRIVAKLDMLLGRLDAGQKRLGRIPTLVNRFRQSVLASACSGRLTADWREDDGYRDDLPTGWKRIQLDKLLPPGGIFDGPFGSNLKTSDYTHSGVRVIRLENIDQLRFINERKTYISREKYSTLKKHTVSEGDIIFASFIDEEIRACVLPKLETTAIAKADCFCLRPKTDLVDREYLSYQLVSHESYDALIQDVHGATRPRINTNQLRNLEIRVCPVAEQREIVRRMKGLFALTDQIKAQYAKAQAQADKLPQSLLAKAFRGELVPTEAELARREGRDYEDAQALLERLSARIGGV